IDREGELYLFLARLGNGEAELGKSELATRHKQHSDDEWPAAIADYYLGKIDGEKLLKLAGREDYKPKERRCEARSFIAALRTVRGESDQASAVKEAARAECSTKGAPSNPDA